MRAPFRILILVAIAGLSTACARPGPYHNTQGGALLGAATGAVIGHQIDHKDGAWIGGATGALIGGAIGNNMDAQERWRDDPGQSDGYYDDDYGRYAPPPPGQRRRPPGDDYGSPYSGY